jgi:hypothetical protein
MQQMLQEQVTPWKLSGKVLGLCSTERYMDGAWCINVVTQSNGVLCCELLDACPMNVE